MAIEHVPPPGAQSRKCHVCRKNLPPMTDAEWDEEWQRHERTKDHEENVMRGTAPPLPCITCSVPRCEGHAVGPWQPNERNTLRCKNEHDLSEGEVKEKRLPWWWLKREYPEIYAELSRTGRTSP